MLKPFLAIKHVLKENWEPDGGVIKWIQWSVRKVRPHYTYLHDDFVFTKKERWDCYKRRTRYYVYEYKQLCLGFWSTYTIYRNKFDFWSWSFSPYLRTYLFRSRSWFNPSIFYSLNFLDLTWMTEMMMQSFVLELLMQCWCCCIVLSSMLCFWEMCVAWEWLISGRFIFKVKRLLCLCVCSFRQLLLPKLHAPFKTLQHWKLSLPVSFRRGDKMSEKDFM